MKNKSLLISALINLVLTNSVIAAEDNVHFSGALVSVPCTIPDEDKDIKLDFGSIIEKSLYQYERTKSIPFTIHLQDCEPSIMKLVSVTFQGTADAELTDMLQLDTTSIANGVAIGMEQNNGQPLKINDASLPQNLLSGRNDLLFYSFIQAKPTAIAGKSINSGTFSAFSTFVLDYK
ncbi:fimbrial protein [Cronobacter turicensis]|nr:fimbrial protein [Cronobacter turicensis]